MFRTVTSDGEVVGRGEVFLDLQAVVDFFEQRPEYALIMEGPELRVVAVNRPLRELLAGRKVLGEPYFDVVGDLIGQGYRELFRGVYETGEPADGEAWQVQFQHPDGSNSVLWVDYDLVARRRPGSGSEGTGSADRIVGIWAEAEDVTREVLARKALQAEMRSLAEQYEQARAVIDTLQRVLLPDRVPVLPTLDVAARYLLATDELAAGGDWFDVVVRDGHALLVVGDVVGHGVAASAAMGQLRAVLLDRLATEPTVADAVAALDRRAAHDTGSFGATVCVVDVDLATGELDYVTAGHPPPLVLDGSGDEAGRYLEPTGAGPLGTAGPGCDVASRRDRLEEGEVVVLYTDGIVELPGRTPLQATVELARAARRAERNTLLPVDAPESAAERIASHAIEALTRVEGYSDDITLLAAQRTARPGPLRLRLPADQHAPVVVREAVRAWLAVRRVRGEDVDVVLHVVTELADNVVDHAYGTVAPEGDGPVGEVAVRCDLDDAGRLELVVADGGRWEERHPPGEAGRGLGLALVGDMVDELRIVHGEGGAPGAGTHVTVRHRLSRTAGVLDVDVAVAAPPVDEPDFDVWCRETTAGVVVGARGDLDARAVGKLRAQLVAATAPGRPPACLDLRGVTLLASAAVHLLLRVLRDAGDLRIVAPAGSVAQHVLQLTAIPHTTEVPQLDGLAGA
jgi:serine phosphatase RsbU (regulator of sigma subunit)/anti-sigma regulatory factor (Ser/Thr protein kinase)/anti-anti-sigma regulatory factor